MEIFLPKKKKKEKRFFFLALLQMRGQKIKLGEPYHGLNHTDWIMSNPHPWHFMGPAKLRARLVSWN